MGRLSLWAAAAVAAAALIVAPAPAGAVVFECTVNTPHGACVGDQSCGSRGGFCMNKALKNELCQGREPTSGLCGGPGPRRCCLPQGSGGGGGGGGGAAKCTLASPHGQNGCADSKCAASSGRCVNAAGGCDGRLAAGLCGGPSGRKCCIGGGGGGGGGGDLGPTSTCAELASSGLSCDPGEVQNNAPLPCTMASGTPLSCLEVCCTPGGGGGGGGPAPGAPKGVNVTPLGRTTFTATPKRDPRRPQSSFGEAGPDRFVVMADRETSSEFELEITDEALREAEGTPTGPRLDPPLLLSLLETGATGFPQLKPDQFQQPNALLHPFSAVVRTGVGCTGAWISEKIVLTAAHCLVDEDTGDWSSWSLATAATAENGGTPPFGTKTDAAMMVVAGQYKKYAKDHAAEPLGYRYDWGLIIFRTARPHSPAGGTGSLGFRVNTGGEVTIAGYPSDKGNHQMWVDTCSIVDGTPDGTHTCEAFGGDSGAPMFDATTYIRGIHSGRRDPAEDPVNTVAVATIIKKDIFDWIMVYRNKHG